MFGLDVSFLKHNTNFLFDSFNELDGLFHEFRTLLAEMITAREELVQTFREAKQGIDLASAVEGGIVVRSAAMAIANHPEVMVERRNIMGVVVPSVTGEHLTSTIDERGMGLVGGSPYIDEAADGYSALIEKIVKAAEMEATLKRLLEEIEATKRRVNALEFVVIPQMEDAKVFIQLRLEEMESEETFRLKRFKNK